MKRSATQSRGNWLHRFGIRVTAGPWTIYADRQRAQRGAPIVALGRRAGSAVTRSRVRRITREFFRQVEGEQLTHLDVLLLARSDVSCRPRRQVRADISGLVTRALAALARREAKPIVDA